MADEELSWKAITRKWLIPDVTPTIRADQRRYWFDLYQRKAVGSVFSMTADSGVRDKVFNVLSNEQNMSHILIPGCGVHVDLQIDLLGRLPDLHITCTDYAHIVDECAAQVEHPGLEYRDLDTTSLPWRSVFDAVVIVNSILSGSDAENRDMLDGCAKTLKPGGVLLGFFPNIFCALDIALLENNADKMANIDLELSLCYERAQGAQQVFYSPLRLRRILREAGLMIEVFETFFCDSEHFAREGIRLYDLFDEDLVPYEHFVVARKQATWRA